MNANAINSIANNRTGAGARWTVALLALSFVFDAVARQSSGGSAAGLNGRWYHNGAPTQILVAPDGRSITIVNESGQRNDGYATDPRNVVIPSLGITGHVNKTGRKISWTNNTEWTRDRNGPGPNFPIKLGGRWFHNGQPTSIDVTSDGQHFTITNELGHRSSGYVSPDRELVIPSLGVTGRIRDSGQRISWSNDTEWTRDRKVPVPNFPTKLSGRWSHNGHATSIDVTPDGRNFTITNEWGQRSDGYISRHHELVIPSLGVTGRISDNGQRISWSNGTAWTRSGLYISFPGF